jgi:hypothetical protein
MQEGSWENWLLWAQATEQNQATVDMLIADKGEYLGFAPVTALKN